MLKKYAEVWSRIKDCIAKINDNKPKQCGSVECGKDYMKIKFNSDDNLPLNKILKFRMLTIILRSIFEGDNIYYFQVFLDDCLYEV